MGTSEPVEILSGEKGAGEWGGGGEGQRGWSGRGMICNGLVSIPSWEIVIPQLPGYYTLERQTSTNLISLCRLNYLPIIVICFLSISGISVLMPKIARSHVA